MSYQLLVNKVSIEYVPFGKVPEVGIDIKSIGGYGWFSWDKEMENKRINIDKKFFIFLYVIYNNT